MNCGASYVLTLSFEWFIGVSKSVVIALSIFGFYDTHLKTYRNKRKAFNGILTRDLATRLSQRSDKRCEFIIHPLLE